jgi:hypothetical protein
MTIGNRYMEPIARSLYQEIGMIEEQHVTQYESLLDPMETWFEQLVHHEYNECYLYHSFLQQESDPQVRALWELHLGMEIEQLRIACDLMRRYDGREAEEILPLSLPEPPVRFEPNKDFVRGVLAEQLELTTDRLQFAFDKPDRYHDYQHAVHGDGPTVAPSEVVIDQHVDQFGSEYRIQTEGEHPNERLRESSHSGRRG